ncbi:MAG TPA: hypothetical protein VGO90_18080 [Chthoniobacteraceae bacterium]|nr:hypothetical protein [Chthoniobacteraceae bacterium]
MFLPRTLLILAFALPTFAADLPRVSPAGELPKDVRLAAPKDLDGYFPWSPLPKDAWIQRAEALRLQTRIALGLWPEPTRTPLNAVVHGRLEFDDYTVEKVFFESMPGFFVTGTLYRPRTGPGPFPAVLCPHGHWPEGRFQNRGDAEMKKELETGGERFLESGRSIFQSTGVHLARIGCVAFVYDMLGYADSQQISHEVAHKFARQRPEMNAAENWGLFSPQAEAHGQSIMGLQTWNSIRALDFLTSLPDVDAKRLGCTGASGGGTQTFLLGAIDVRLTVAAPAVMVSTAMQGGCTCENASLLRVGTGNIELAALFAPRPMGMTTANDWTRELPTKGFPDLQKHWAMLGAPKNVQLWPMPQFPHNYNAPTREKIYAFLNEHFALGLQAEQLIEREFSPLTKEQLTVWDAAHPTPPGGPEFERKLLRWWHDDTQKQLATAPDEFRKIAQPAWQTLLDRSGPTRGEARKPVNGAPPKTDVVGGFTRLVLDFGNTAAGEALPAIILKPKGRKLPTVIWLSESGKAGLFDAAGEPQESVRRLLEAGFEVIGVDLFMQGEFLPAGSAAANNRVVKNPREAPAYTYGYNHALFAQRVQDVAWLVDWLRRNGQEVSISALDSTGPIAAGARALKGDAIRAAALHTNGFRFGALQDWRDANFLPAAARYGDLPGLLAVGAPLPTYVSGEAGLPLTFAGYQAHGAENQFIKAEAGASPAAAITWLIAHGR